MAHRQIVMLACVEDHTTPRVRVKDDFSAVLVSGLGEGDEVRMVDDPLTREVVLLAGVTPFPTPRSAFVRFQKVSGTSPKPTSVEIHRGS